jgi:hypothetical protein
LVALCFKAAFRLIYKKQQSIKRSFLLYFFLSGLFFSGFVTAPIEVNAKELNQIAQSSAGDEGDDEDDEDC